LSRAREQRLLNGKGQKERGMVMRYAAGIRKVRVSLLRVCYMKEEEPAWRRDVCKRGINTVVPASGHEIIDRICSVSLSHESGVEQRDACHRQRTDRLVSRSSPGRSSSAFLLLP